MKRTIAIMLVLLFCISPLVGCGRRDNNVSERNDGMIESDGSSGAVNSTASNEHNKKKTSDDHTNDIKDDIGKAIDDTGEVIGDIGRDIGDAVTGKDAEDAHRKDIK